MATKGTTRSSKVMNKFFGKNGRLKPEFTRRADAQAEFDKTAALRGDCKKRRYAHLKEAALARRTLAADDGNAAASKTSFSSAVTEELLSSLNATLPAVGLGDIAESRPPDNAVLEAKESGPACNFDDDSHLSSAEQVQAEEEHDETIPAHRHSEEQEETMSAHPHCQKNPEDLSSDELNDVLRDTFLHENFRPGQQEAISSVLARRRTLLLLATGAGKSLCYQVPAYLLREEGLTLVISPLVSLMKDQLFRLPRCLRGALISGQQSRQEARQVMRAVRARLVDVLYISPERLSCWAFDGCGLPPIALACIDEAHCVSEWSHNFRPDYLRLHEFLIGSLGARRLLALSATATRPTIKSIFQILQLDAIVRADRCFSLEELLAEPSQPRVQRANLTMDVIRVGDNEDAQVKQLVKLLRMEEYAKCSAVVYVWKRMQAEQLSKQLRTWIKGGVFAYHGSLLPATRSAVQDAFMTGAVRVVVATMAFGMGLDKPDIRMVIHYNIPKSIEHYVQETGRCSRDGEQGRCVTLVNPKDYKGMRWMQSGAGKGNGPQTGIIHKLINLIYGDSTSGIGKRYTRHELSEAAVAEMTSSDGGSAESLGSWHPYYVAFEEHEVAKELGIQTDELHSALAHWAHLAKSHVVLHSRFPNELKLRFFKTEVNELAKSDPLLGKVMPIAKCRGGVHTLNTAQALALLGGKPSQLANGLWMAQGDEFSLEKAEYGYMLAVLKPASAAQMESWISDVAEINRMAHRNGIEKLDAAYFALCRAADVSMVDEAESNADRSSFVDKKLNGLIDDYFAATVDPSLVVAGTSAEQNKLKRDALGSDYLPPPRSDTQDMSRRAGEETNLRQSAVTTQVAKLITSSDWPKLPSEDPASIARAVAQFLAGISTPMLPYKNWKAHRCWGIFKNCGDFEEFSSMVDDAYKSVQKIPMLAAKKA